MTLTPSLAALCLKYLPRAWPCGQAEKDELEKLVALMHRVSTGDETVDL